NGLSSFLFLREKILRSPWAILACAARRLQHQRPKQLAVVANFALQCHGSRMDPLNSESVLLQLALIGQRLAQLRHAVSALTKSLKHVVLPLGNSPVLRDLAPTLFSRFAQICRNPFSHLRPLIEQFPTAN